MPVAPTAAQQEPMNLRRERSGVGVSMGCKALALNGAFRSRDDEISGSANAFRVRSGGWNFAESGRNAIFRRLRKRSAREDLIEILDELGRLFGEWQQVDEIDRDRGRR